VRAENADPDKQELLDFFKDKVASWWIPNDVVFVDALPLTATGKVKKLDLRKQFAEYQFPD
jgi:fatty-acyl-CoA synthase